MKIRTVSDSALVPDLCREGQPQFAVRRNSAETLKLVSHFDQCCRGVYRRHRARLKKLLFATLLLVASVADAQIYVFVGGHENYVRNKVLANESPLTSWHIGGGVRLIFSESKPRTVFNAEYAFVKKGYYQTLGGTKSSFNFNYLTYQATVGQQLFPYLSVKGGFNFAILIDSNLKKWYQTYRMVDFGLVGGLDFLENKRVGFYTRVVYGLIPMLKYDNIDALGNFNGTIRDLRNTSFMVGLRVKVYEKELRLRH
ncbi:MAG: hypothetical protein ABI477_06960 [Chryseolinea sp.]